MRRARPESVVMKNAEEGVRLASPPSDNAQKQGLTTRLLLCWRATHPRARLGELLAHAVGLKAQTVGKMPIELLMQMQDEALVKAVESLDPKKMPWGGK